MGYVITSVCPVQPGIHDAILFLFISQDGEVFTRVDFNFETKRRDRGNLRVEEVDEDISSLRLFPTGLTQERVKRFVQRLQDCSNWACFHLNQVDIFGVALR